MGDTTMSIEPGVGAVTAGTDVFVVGTGGGGGGNGAAVTAVGGGPT